MEAQSLSSVQAAAVFDYAMMALNVIERIFAMLLHIGLTVIVFYGIKNAKWRFLPLAILLHMLSLIDRPDLKIRTGAGRWPWKKILRVVIILIGS